MQYANVENYHFASQTAIINGKRVFVSRHELLKGPYRGPTYGFELIEMSKLPKSLIERAKERSEVSVSQREKSMLKSRAFLMRRAKLRCGRRLRQWLKAIKKLSEVDKPTKEEKRDCLKALRNQYRNEIVDIEEEFGPEDDGNQQQNEENDGQAELGDENQWRAIEIILIRLVSLIFLFKFQFCFFVFPFCWN